MAGSGTQCQIRASIEIHRPSPDVWQLLGNFEAVEAWASAVTSSRRTTGPDIGVGSRRTLRYRWILRLEEAVTEWTEGERLAYDVFGAPFPFRDFHETWCIQATPEGCVVTACVEYCVKGGPVGRALNALLMRHLLRREVLAGLQGLKRTAEAREPVAPRGVAGSGPAPTYSPS